MSRAKRLITLVTLLFTAAASALQSTTSSNTNLRASPSTSARVLAVIPKATVLTVGSCTTWRTVSYGGLAGRAAG